MNRAQVIVINEQKRTRIEAENIGGIFLPTSQHASSAVGIIDPHATQVMHIHNRPESGDEIVFVYAGHVELIVAGESMGHWDIAMSGPVYMRIPSGTVAQLRNRGSEPAYFFSVFAPPFELNELRFLDSSEGDNCV